MPFGMVQQEGFLMQEFMKIPKERIAVLIGKNGSIKRKIESLLEAKIEVDSETGEISVESKGDDAVNFQKALDIVKAIGRGFSPERAFLLVDEDWYLDVINLHDFVGKSEKALKEKKGRVIGTGGKSRKLIEEKTNCFISVYGKTIAFVGNAEGIEIARKSVEMLLEGATHKAVENLLRKAELEEKKFRL